MCCGNYRTASLFVGWLNIVSSVLASIFYIYKLLAFEKNLPESGEIVENDIESVSHNGVIQGSILHLAVCVGLWVVPSILLVKGIKENRHKLVAPWLYITYVSIAMNCIFWAIMFWFETSFSGSFVAGLYSSIPYSVGVVISILCIHPVRKLYMIMSNPPPVLPTMCRMETKKPEDHERFMPVFDNC